MKEIKYCKKWWRHYKKPVGPLSIEEAKKFHENKESYAAFVQGDNQVDAFLEINLSLLFVGSSFLDEHLREYITYSFQGRKEKVGQLFLTTAMSWEYPDDSDDFIKSMRYEFDVDGKVFMEEIDLVEGFKETSETTFDPNKNWETIPEFGHYEAFLKFER